jgi:hypothetical protein
MAEVINTNVFDAEKKFVDFAGLDYFWDKAKEHIDGADAKLSGRIDTAAGDISGLKTVVGDADSGLVKDLATLTGRVDALNAEGGIDSMIDAKINALDSADAAVAGEYVSSVAQADGKITVVRTALPDYSETYDAKGAAGTAEKNAKDYADGLAKNYDAAGTAAGLDAAMNTRVAKLEAIDHNKLATDAAASAVATVLDGAPDAFDTLKEVADWISNNDHAEEVADLVTDVENLKKIDHEEAVASKTKLGQKIVIAGGPLANNIAESGEVWPAKWTNGNEKFIPEDATMADIVMNLFCVEKWPSSISTSNATLVSSMDTPSLTYNGKTANNNSTTVEVGTTVSYEAKSGKSSYTATPYKASGFTYGYSAANDNTVDNTGTSKSASFGTISAVSDSIPTLTLSGKVSETINGTAATADAGAASKSGSVVIALGDNKIKAQSKSITYTGTCSALPVYYGCSNLGNTEKELSTGEKQTYPSTAKSETTLTSTAVNSGTIEINCVGAYKVFVGYVAEVPTTSAGVRAMNANNRLGKGNCGTTDEVYTINNNYMVVAVPTGWDFTIQNDLGQADQRNSFSKSDAVVNVELPNHTAEAPSTLSYDIWSIGWSGGAYKNLVIK